MIVESEHLILMMLGWEPCSTAASNHTSWRLTEYAWEKSAWRSPRKISSFDWGRKWGAYFSHTPWWVRGLTRKKYHISQFVVQGCPHTTARRSQTPTSIRITWRAYEQIAGPPPRASNSLDLDWGSRVCIFNKVSDDANASGKGPYFEQNCCR